jgi:ABC-type glycerol-3-phosphate transport system substrate-binding protein
MRDSSRRKVAEHCVRNGSTALALVMLLSSCSNSQGTPEMAKAENKLEEPKAPVELVFQELSGGTEEQFNDFYGNRIRKKLPNYSIKFIRSEKGTTFPELMAANQRVDIVISTVNTIMQRISGAEYDMTDLLKTHNVDLSTLETPVIEGMQQMFDGKLYALPVKQVKQVMFYNKGLFDKFGVPYPKNGMTWEETAELSKIMTRSDGGKAIFGFVASPVHVLSSNQLSKPYLDQRTLKPTFLDKEWPQLYQAYFLAVGSDPSLKNRTLQLKRLPYRKEFTNTQEVAMFGFNSQFPFDSPEDIALIDWDLVSLPTFTSMPNTGSQSLPVTVAITSMAQNKDAAMEAIKALISEDTQSDFSKKGIIPILSADSLKKVFATETIYKDKNWQAIFHNPFAKLSFKSNYDAQIQQYAQDTARDLISGTIPDLNTALRKLNEKTEKYVEAATKK